MQLIAKMRQRTAQKITRYLLWSG